LVYVPNNTTNTVQVIDPATFSVIATYPTGREPQHVVPSWDMKTLWVNDDLGNDMVPIDPVTGRPGKPVKVEDPYNLYFTPDGAHALVMAERMHRIDVVNPQTMAPERSLPVPCDGVNHADYSADLSFFVASCEFSGQLLVVDRNATKLLKVIDLNSTKTPGATSVGEAMRMGGPKSGLTPGASAMPQDVRLTPDGTRFLVADMLRNGIWVINASTQKVERFIPTGKGAHGIYPDREGRRVPSRSWTRRRWPSPRPGRSPAEGRPTWVESLRMARSYGSRDATTQRSTSSTPRPGPRSDESRSTQVRMVSWCGRSRARFLWDTQATCDRTVGRTGVAALAVALVE
jgi:YVTN family beta-propeller protein